MTSHCITWHDTTQAITSHQMTWPSHDLTPQQTSRHQNTSLQSTKHHHHGTAEGSFTAKKWFGHRAGRSPCAHSIGKFFLCYIVLFLLETSAPGLSGYYWYCLSKQRCPLNLPILPKIFQTFELVSLLVYFHSWQKDGFWNRFRSTIFDTILEGLEDGGFLPGGVTSLEV